MLQAIRFFFAIVGRLSPALAGRLAADLFARPRRHARPARERELIARGEPVTLPDGLGATSWRAARRARRSARRRWLPGRGV
jgi:hypothetical protein